MKETRYKQSYDYLDIYDLYSGYDIDFDKYECYTNDYNSYLNELTNKVINKHSIIKGGEYEYIAN